MKGKEQQHYRHLHKSSPSPSPSRSRSRSRSNSLHKNNQNNPSKKRKRSYSGIDLPSPSETNDDFAQFKIHPAIVEKLQLKQIVSLFEVQKAVFTPLYEGTNVIVRSLTGSGKTLAFILPLLQRSIDKGRFKNEKPIIMVMAPTRELSIQVGREFSDLSSTDLPFKTAMIYGGVSMDEQIVKLKSGCDIIVGTPGRIIDMIERKHLSVSKIKAVVLDEADKMLSMGFEEQIESVFNKIKECHEKFQVCLFSATIEKWVKDVANKIIPQNNNIKYIDLVKDLTNKTPSTVTHLGVNCLKNEKTTTIADLILCYGGKNKATIVFVNTKRECNDLMISDKIKTEVQIIHGDINQAQREATLSAFRSGKLKVLVATDVASRGLDIPIVDLVIQSEPPKEAETYIHRAGRTARAGRSGTCITLYTRYTECLLERIEQKAKIKVKRIGAPQKKDIIEASIRDTNKCLIGIDESMIKLFSNDAKRLIEEFGSENVVARLLAYVSGHTDKMKSRSLLCGAESYITYAIKFTNKFQHAGYVWGFFKRLLKDEVRSQIKGMRLFASLDGCVFDYPEESHEIFEEILYNDRYYGTNFTLETIDELPELMGIDEQKGNRNIVSNIGMFSHNNNTNIRGRSANTMRYREGKCDIFVGNLPYNIDEIQFKEWLEKNGLNGIDFDARLAVDKETGTPRGFGFISVFNKEHVKSVLKLNGREFLRRKLVINESKSK